MSWRLEFYRRVGQAPLVLAEVDAYFGELVARGELERSSEPGAVPGSEEVLYERPIAAAAPGAPPPDPGVGYQFVFLSIPEERLDDSSGDADFPFEPTGLELLVPFLQSEPLVIEAIAAALEASGALGLFGLDPQVDQELPSTLAAETLLRSYTNYNRDVEETLEYVRRRGRGLAIVVLSLLGLSVIWLVLALIARR